MAHRGAGPWAAAGGLLLVISLWLPWFHRELSGMPEPLRSERSLSGWVVLEAVGGVLLVPGLAVARWGLQRSLKRFRGHRQQSPFWLVLTGGLALVVQVQSTVNRIGVQDVPCCPSARVTTTPAFGLTLALAGAVVVVLAGIGALMSEARTRSRAT